MFRQPWAPAWGKARPVLEQVQPLGHKWGNEGVNRETAEPLNCGEGLSGLWGSFAPGLAGKVGMKP